MKAAKRKLFFIIAAVISLVSPIETFGHTAGLSTTDAQFVTNGLEIKLTFALVDFNGALIQLNDQQKFDGNEDGRLTTEEVNTGWERLKKFAMEMLLVAFDGQAVSPSVPVLKLDENQNFVIDLNYAGPRPKRLLIRALVFEYLPEGHRHFISVRDEEGKELGNRMAYAGDNTLELALGPEAESSVAKTARVESFQGFLLLGIKHIWTGYDHLLFLLAVLLVCDRFKAAVQVVTCFTVAHSITLAFATFKLVWVSSRIVEPMIAASIVYVGLENFFVPEGRKGRWLITFLFGLVHGLGFATILAEMGVGSGAGGATVPLVAFNLGVEVGQLVIAAILLPVIWKLRQSKVFLRRGLPACSAVVAAMGTYWLVQRVWFH